MEMDFILRLTLIHIFPPKCSAGLPDSKRDPAD